MTTMPSWLTDIDESVKAATDASQARGQAADLGRAASQLTENVVDLRAFVVASALGDGSWWPGYTGTPDLFEKITKAMQTSNSANLEALSRALLVFVSSAKNQLLEDWKEYGGKRLGNVADLVPLANTLAGVVSVAPLATSLLKVLGQLAQAQRSVPTAAAFDLLAEAEAHLANLERALQPAAVRAFASAAARGGASLDLLTDEVREWLKKHAAERSFKITAGPPDAA